MDNPTPRILSPAFGCCGTFALDEKARYAVVQGAAWLIRSKVEDAELLLAYLALFNSYEFESLLDLQCRRVAGGQYELRRSHLANVLLPELSQVNPALVRRLAREGEQISRGNGIDPLSMSEVVSEAYGIDRERFRSEFAKGRVGRLHDEFILLASQWKKQTRLWSNVTKMANQPSYQKIIAMGVPVIPWILRDLAENGPNHWFWALTKIAGEGPVADISPHGLTQLTEAWLQWGLTKGYLRDYHLKTRRVFQTSSEQGTR
jgi:hypothetical protein